MATNLERNRTYRERNREKVRVRVSTWHKEHCERRREHQRAYRATHRAELRAKLQEWRLKNPEKDRASDLRRRALKNLAPGTCTVDQLQARIDFYGGRCWLCSKPYEAIDHVIPLSKGGSNWPANLRPACKSCNSRKGSKSWRGNLSSAQPTIRS